MSTTSYNKATLEFIQKDKARRQRQRMIATAVGLLAVVAIAAGGWWAWSAHQANQKLAVKEALVAEIKPGQGREAFDKVRQAVEAGQITREEARDIGREAWEKREKEVMDGFFATPAKDRDKYLDKQIDEMQKRMAEWQRDRPTTRPTTRPAWTDRNNGPTSRPAQTDAERQARAASRANNQSPMERAQRDEFRAAMMARMKERGIEMPFGGGRGGPGGGWGGRGGGPGGGGRGGR